MTNNRVAWLSPDDPIEGFPPVSSALDEPDGLLAAGGDLSPERLLYAYRHGIFPWYDDGQPLLWWSPDPRCVFLAGDYRLSRRMHRALRHSGMEIRFNSAFRDVVRACALPRRSEQGTWITTDMMTAYDRLHDLGWAHSVEIWQSGRLCGGLYGLAIGKAFFGESMYSRTANASKFALLQLASMLDSGALELLDCQVISRHLLSLGARTMPRNDFVRHLEKSCHPPKRFENWPNAPITALRLLPE